jgi:inositol-phosphate transport system substrate-binding protein
MLLRWLSLPRNVIIVLLVMSFLLTRYDTSAHENLTAEKRCGYEPGQFDKVPHVEGAVEVSVWARTNGIFCWRAFLPVEAAKLVSDLKIVVRPKALANGSGFDASSILQAASKGEGPDIAYLGYEAINQAYDLGYIEPLDACLSRYPEFDLIRKETALWSPLIRGSKRLGIPIEPSVAVLFFSKSRLRDLGWSQAKIDQLPMQIREGQFTLDDMANVAGQAVEEGVVQSGLGYWPDVRRVSTFLLLYKAFGGVVPLREPFHLSRTVLQSLYAFHRRVFTEHISQTAFAGQEIGTSFVGRILYRDTVSHGRVLFWPASLPDWKSEYAANYLDELGGMDYVSTTIGFALFPSGVRGQPASARELGTGTYVILSQKATGRQNQALACAVLAKVMTPEIYSKFARSTSTLSTLMSQDDTTAKEDSFTRETSYFWDYVWEAPQQKDYSSNRYLLILDKYLAEVERGKLSPQDAANLAIHEIQDTLGDVVIVEP